MVAEVLGYLGGVLALVAGWVLGAESWAQLGRWGRVGVLAVVTGVLLAAGWWLRPDQGRTPGWPAVLGWGRWRRSRGCWVCSWAAPSDDAFDQGSLGAAVGALVLAGALYLLEQRALQQLALFVALAATMVAAGRQLGWSWDTGPGVRPARPSGRGGWSWAGAGWWCRGGPRRRWGPWPSCQGRRSSMWRRSGWKTWGCGSGWGWR